MTSDLVRVARDRIRRVFRYLQALNDHRNPAKRQISEQPWLFWLRDLPTHNSVRKGPSFSETPTPVNVEGESSPPQDHQLVFSVRRPESTAAPVPPDSIVSMLDRGWEDPFGEVRIRSSLTDEELTEFEGDASRTAALSKWRRQRELWALSERPVRQALRVFERLFELHGRIEREGERVELLVGDGILAWRVPEGGITHPIVLQRVHLEFDPKIPEFRVVDSDRPPELYTALFTALEGVDPRALAKYRDALEEGGFSPLGGEDTSGFLRAFVQQLSPRGRLTDQGAPRTETDDPVAGRDPVLFLRERSLGFATAIEGIISNIETREDFPGHLSNIVGANTTALDSSALVPDGETGQEPANASVDVLFSKPANAEQAQIVRQLAEHSAVLVQGPPGTGKSHTIANLIGHLLAEGKSILVTTHTTKALRVLRDYVVEDLRPLCVSVLESDLDSRKQLEASVEAIAERLSRLSPSQLDAEASRLATKRSELISALEKSQHDLLAALTSEYREVVVAGEGVPPLEAARWMAQHAHTAIWIPGPVSRGSPLPLTEVELRELYRTSVALTQEDEDALARMTIEPNALPRPDSFANHVSQQARLTEEATEDREDLWASSTTDRSPEELETLGEDAAHAISVVSSGELWRFAAIEAGRVGGPDRNPWNNLILLVGDLRDKASRAKEHLLRNAPVLAPHISLDEQKAIVDEIVRHLERGGKLGRLQTLIHASWKRLIEQAKVAGGSPKTVDHFRALRSLISITLNRRDLAGRWDRQMVPGGAPRASSLGAEPELGYSQFAPQIAECLDWYGSSLAPLVSRLKSFGFGWDRFINDQPPNTTLYGELIRLRDAIVGPLQEILQARAISMRLRLLEQRQKSLHKTLADAVRTSGSVGVIRKLHEAVLNLSPSSYDDAHGELITLLHRKSDFELRHSLLTRLEVVAPGWAEAIRERREPHGDGSLPGNAAEAWRWRQFAEELDDRGRISLDEIQTRIGELKERLQEVTARLISCRAWSAQAKRTSVGQRQALVGWLDMIRRIGKGFGKRVPRLRLEATRRMADARSAVPVWIMPLTRVVESFDPSSTRFDVVIIDEASQSDVMALIALYLAQAVVIVGDHEQVSPLAVGQRILEVQNLIDTHLQGIPNAILYDGQMSVYDLARQTFGGAIVLQEHFRCVPDIIQFSNQLSYNGRIKPLRDSSASQLRPPVVAYRVSEGSSHDKINHTEAASVAALAVAACEQPEYKDKSFGVISMLGEEQAIAIEGLLLRHLSPQEFEQRRFLCGTAAQFQGDERDVMFLSLVDEPREGPLKLRTETMYKQRYNVAASRARDQLWVVYSLDPRTDLKPGDLRRRLIEYAEDPDALNRALEAVSSQVESEFEKAVASKLIATGYRVIPQWKVGYYRIDLVVEGAGGRVAVECDGERFHPIEKLPEDMERQAILERLGWRFLRIRGSQFWRDPEATMQRLFEELERFGIAPENRVQSSADSEADSLRERVVRRAGELLRTWQEAGSVHRE